MSNQQISSQQQQDEARLNQLRPETKSLLSSSPLQHSDELSIPVEQQCYLIQNVIIKNKQALPHWLPFRDLLRQVEGRCVGIKGVEALHKAVQNRIIANGYITTRVLIPRQDLTTGMLSLEILPGKIAGFVLNNGSGDNVHTFNNFPQHEGDLLDLRGLEQGLENLQRVPGSSAEINLVPGNKPGETTVEVKRKQAKSWRLGLWADDSGSRYTGRYQSGLAFYLDNPTSLNDMFYASYGGGLQNEDGRRTDNVSAFYSIPYGYWQLDLYGTKYRYTQTIHSGDFSYLYSGDEKLLTAQLSRVIFRNTSQKTTLSFKGIKRDSAYWLNDVEVEVQHRNTSSWKMNLQHEAWFSFGQVKANLGYQRAAHWFGEDADAEEEAGSADAQARIITASLDGTFPFTLWGQSMSYEPHFMEQTSPDRLTQPDKFTIGNRWTVRGFDGENTLYADKGWYQRNDINLNFPEWGMQPYLGVDYGEVSGSENDYWSGEHIAGAAIGIRGVKGKFGYDLFAGVPLAKPDEMHVSPVTLGFAMQWQY